MLAEFAIWIPLLINGLAHPSSSSEQKPRDLLVVSGNSWSKSGLNEFLTGGVHSNAGMDAREPELETRLVKLGYHLVESQGERVMFAPEIWQQEKMERDVAALASVASHVNRSGLLSPNGDASLADTARGLLGSCGVDLSANAAVGVGTQTSYTIANGDRTLKIEGPVTFSDSAEAAEQASIQVVKISEGIATKLKFSDFAINWPASYEIHGFGKYRVSGQVCNEGFRSALSMLAQQFAQYAILSKKSKNDAAKALSGRDPSGFKNQQCGALPGWAQDEIRGELQVNFAWLGFSSSDEAVAFFQNAVITDASQDVYLGVMTRGPSGNASPYGVTVQIP